MFGNDIRLFTLLGFRVSIAPSWFLLAILIVWSLAQAYFPSIIDNLSPATAIWMSVVGAIGLFASIVFHEFAHALVARRFDMPISGITLFLFGGVAHLRDEPPGPWAEFLVAIVGPISSYFLAGVFALGLLPGTGGEIGPVEAVIGYLVTINLVLATFNLLPAFPLDGGRVLRAAIWGWTGSLRRATHISAICGRVLGGAVVLLGALNVVYGDLIGGMWLVLVGMFISAAAGASEAHTDLRIGLDKVQVRDVMNPVTITAPADLTVAELVEDYFYRHYHKAFPVVRGETLLGCVRLEDVGRVPRERWQETRIADILTDDNARHVIEPEKPVWNALNLMKDEGVSRLMVVDRGALVGMLTMRDLMQYVTVRRQLGGGKWRKAPSPPARPSKNAR
ncbi:site-2 protease family protein [Defluviimonas sp. WL0002]|uniref:Zinc metalloprotease n=1 Tax=Albidovulum marisflavi TaxID=2984159 RepID=A0ABT2ZCR4_9RHOB|nr:site-2 protease family protein [Defluviimonas sp. WL0002]MCV2868855.1 site-2 protease family protein [Defluviimonas sp. WL0002]